MNALIVPTIEPSDDGTLRVSSQTIAEGAGIEHRAVLQLADKHQSRLEKFGLVSFEMRARPEGQHGGGNVRVALLNEQQATLLMTFMKNTERVIDFKVALVDGFFTMAQQLTAAPALTGPALLAAALIEAQATLETHRQQVLQLEPRAQAWDSFLGSTGDYSVNEAAKVLSRDKNIHIGEGRLRALLEEWRWIYRHSGKPRAMQTQIDTGRLTEKASFYYHPETGEKVAKTPQVRITPKGLDAIAKRMHEVAA